MFHAYVRLLCVCVCIRGPYVKVGDCSQAFTVFNANVSLTIIFVRDDSDAARCSSGVAVVVHPQVCARGVCRIRTFYMHSGIVRMCVRQEPSPVLSLFHA